MRLMVFLCFVLLAGPSVSGQRPADVFYPKRGILTHIYYGYQVPGADLYKRFGGSSTLGLNVSYKTHNNWLLGAEFDYIFGSRVFENTALDSLADKDGLIYDVNGNPAVIRLYERGFTAFATAGRVVWKRKKNENSGLVVKLGAGILQHRIKYVTNFDLLPQLDGDYIKGYDKLSNGVTGYIFAGYQHLDPQLRLSFIAGLEFYQAYTYNRRAYNYDTRAADTKRRNDQLLGAKVGIIVPVYFKDRDKKDEEHYFK